MDQRELVVRAREGDHDAFAMLARGSSVRLDAAARLVLRDPELARDVVQDVLLEVWRDLPGLRNPDRFDAWVHRLTARACLDQIRRRRSRPIEVELAAFDLAAGDRQYGILDRDELERGFQRLAPEQRALIVLHYYLDMTLPDAAASLGIPLGTAKSRLHRAVDALRAALEADRRASPVRLEQERFA